MQLPPAPSSTPDATCGCGCLVGASDLVEPAEFVEPAVGPSEFVRTTFFRFLFRAGAKLQPDILDLGTPRRHIPI